MNSPTRYGVGTGNPPDPEAMNQPAAEQVDHPIDPKWGHIPRDNFGYQSDQERLATRGMEDWELITKIPESQRRVPYWFIGVVVIVLLVGIGLGFPFWGQRKGVHVQWFNWGFIMAIGYVALAATFVYFMTNLAGPQRAERDDADDGQDRNHGNPQR